MKERTLSLGNIQVVIHWGEKRHAVGAAMGRTTDLLWVILLLRYLPSSHIEKLDLQFMGKSVESTNLKV